MVTMKHTPHDPKTAHVKILLITMSNKAFTKGSFSFLFLLGS